MAITRGFGTLFDFETGIVRNWVMGADGVKRWADTGEPVEGGETKRRQSRASADISGRLP